MMALLTMHLHVQNLEVNCTTKRAYQFYFEGVKTGFWDLPMRRNII